MSFNFHILGLFIIYMLMCMYFMRGNEIKKNNKMFNRLMIVNFGSQFLYLLCFIVLNQTFGSLINSIVVKLFLSSLILWTSIFFCYVYSKVIFNKFVTKNTLYNKKVNSMFYLMMLVSLGLIFINFMLPVSISESIVIGGAFYYTYLVSLIFIISSLFVMLMNIKSVGKNYINIYIPIVVSLVVLIVQSCSIRLGVLASGYTFVILYLYLTLENIDAKTISYLRLAKESAEKSNLEKFEFLEKFNREIRMPLNTIDGYCQVIMDEDDINNIKTDVRDIMLASNNLIDLVNGIMDISLIESSKMEISNHDYDTMEMIESVSMMAKSLINNKDIKFTVDYANNIPRVICGDSDKIKRVLINLFRNAVQFTDKGEIKFKVQAVNSGSVCRLIMSVSDTGCGIKKEDLNTIFNKYERINVKKRNSNGLGLAIVENLVKFMNGKVDVESEVGKGSTFTVTIDQKIVQADAIKISDRESHKLKVFDATGMRVLVVDDNKLNLQVAVKLLKPYNISVVQASSGQEFLDIIDKDRDFDLVLMDDMMPKMSGTETLDIFKKIERVDGFLIPVVVLTANAVSGMRDRYINLGFDEYLAKPIDKYELNRILKKYLKNIENKK